MITLASLFLSLGTSFLLFLGFVALFFVLASQPRNDVIYFPALLEKGIQVRPLTLHRMVMETYNSSEDDVVKMSGIDAAIYLRHLTNAIKLLAFCSFYCVFVLLPICLSDDYYATLSATSDISYTDFSILSMGNITPGSNKIWAFAIGVYWISLGTLYFLFTSFVSITDMRAKYLYTEKPRPEQYGILVQYIPRAPKGVHMAKFVDDFFRKFHPEHFQRSLLISDISEVVKVHRKLLDARRKFGRAEAQLSRSSSPPREKIGLFGCIGEEVDSFEYYKEQTERLERELPVEQRKVLENPSKVVSALVFFDCRKTAASAAHVIYATRLDNWQVSPAPGPTEIIWSNVSISLFERWVRETVVGCIVFATICFYTVPITLISSFTTLTELNTLLPFLEPITNITWIATILEAYLPQLALLTFTAVLPYLLRYLSFVEGYYSQSSIVKAAVSKKFYFSVLNEFIGVTLTAGLFDSLASIIESPASIISLLATSIPDNATFFISYIALKFLTGYGLEISRLTYFFTYYAERAYMLKTDRDPSVLWKPQALSYVNYVPNDLLVIILALCYAVVAPTILPFGILYFALGWLVLKHQILNVYHPQYESAGQLWPLIHRNIVGALIIAQITMIGYFGIKGFVYTPILIPLPIVCILYLYYCHKRFEKIYSITSLEMASHPVERELQIEEIVEAYLPECMAGVPTGIYMHRDDPPQAEGLDLEIVQSDQKR